MATRSIVGDLEMSDLFCYMYRHDNNRLIPAKMNTSVEQFGIGEHYSINLQGDTIPSWDSLDKAPQPLFTAVSDEALNQQASTYPMFIKLLSNYQSDSSIPEEYTEVEIKEIYEFINKIMKTVPMKVAQQFLQWKGVARDDFERQLFDIWFKLYRTKGVSARDEVNTCGFEHVFVGESRRGFEPGQSVVTGFHNWLQFHLEEKKGKIDYHGYVIDRKPYDPARSRLITVKFRWKNDVKRKSSMFIGTSPEFEMAVYTVVYLCGHAGDNPLLIDNHLVNIRMFSHEDQLATVYPVLMEEIRPWMT